MPRVCSTNNRQVRCNSKKGHEDTHSVGWAEGSIPSVALREGSKVGVQSCGLREVIQLWGRASKLSARAIHQTLKKGKANVQLYGVQNESPLIATLSPSDTKTKAQPWNRNDQIVQKPVLLREMAGIYRDGKRKANKIRSNDFFFLYTFHQLPGTQGLKTSCSGK